ncbi:MAG: DNA polymerase/3'-5' exonuclease PolX [Phycisphaeraceae bacterium]|nr:DNA polymerase/3'-5' exonuclease PolX [Phycisphaeraceae bacterium]
MALNAAIAQRLEEIAKMIEVLGEDQFRAISNSRAARNIDALPFDIATIADDKAKLTEIEGIGPKIADKIMEFAATGKMKEHEELKGKVPAGLLEMMKIPGLGPKTVRAIWQTLHITTLPALKKAIEDGTILTVPRMGEKAAQKIKQAMEFAAQGQARLWLGQAVPVAERIIDVLKHKLGKKVKHIDYAGSLRRGKDTIGDIDILIATPDIASAIEAFTAMPGVVAVLAAGESKASVRVRTDVDLSRWDVEDKTGPTVQADLHVIPDASWGAALMYFTGSKEHNIRLRQRALDRGLTLNDYGLFPDDREDTPPQQRGIKPVASRSEEEIYAKLDLPFIPPELREDRGEVELTATPRLIEVGDIKSELHAHTTASDGSLSIEALAAMAKERGFHTIAVTDHSQSSVIANGLKPERLLAHIEAIRKAQEKFLNRSGKPEITILAGSEVDILADGTLDYDDKILKQLDIVVASPHAALSQDGPAATKRLVKAIRHKYVHILGHPTGRLINQRPGLDPDMAKLIAAAVERRVALEINAHWMRLDLRDTHVRQAVNAGALIAIDCDVHAPDDYDNLRFGVMTGRRGWLTPDLCVNTWPAPKLHEWLKSKR